MEFFTIFFLLFLLFNFVFNNKGIITLPFKKQIPNLNGLSPKEVIEPNYLDNLITTEIRVGTEPQSIKLRIELNSYLFYIAGSNTNSQIKFIQKNSTTYNKVETESHYFSDSKLNEAIFSSDYIYYEQNNDEKYTTNFLLGIDTLKDKSGGLIGLNADNKSVQKYSKYNFINELKKNKIIKDYYFTIKYNDNNSGNLIIGDIPHNYDKNYNHYYFKDIYCEMHDFDFGWNLKFDSIYISDEKNSRDIKKVDGLYAYLNVEKSIIEGTTSYRTILLNYFMQEQINNKICFEVLDSENYYSYYCNEKVNISKVKNLYFYNKELNFTFELTYKDLFYHNEYDGNYYFLIVFLKDDEMGYSSYYWKLGEPLFKKYQFIFNQNTKKIGLYTNFNDNENNIKNENWWSKNKWYVILIILLLILFSGLSVVLFLYIKNKPKRKIKANELDEDFEYNSSNPSNNKLIN